MLGGVLSVATCTQRHQQSTSAHAVSPEIVTLAPSRAKRKAIARPMPCAAPVTTATFPVSILCFLGCSEENVEEFDVIFFKSAIFSLRSYCLLRLPSWVVGNAQNLKNGE